MIKQLPLSELFANKVGSVNPLNFEAEEFELYSIPAYETGTPEKLLGREIGSSKKKLKGGDVLLSRIVPHIRRCWIVPEKNDLRQIGSGEWIVFRSNDIDSSYLRHYLMSDVFHSKFMNTVKGVGGSLLRADPKLTGKLKIPLPPLATQKKIAAILDAADSHRQKTKQLLGKYDELTQSIFLDMFGDPVTNPKGWEIKPLNKICDFRKKSIRPEDISTGEKYVGLEHIEKGTGEISEFVEITAGELKSNKFSFDETYILYGKLRPYLNKVAQPNFKGICSTDIIPIKPLLISDREYVTSILRSKAFVSFADERSSGANLPRINPKEIEKFQCICPPEYLRADYGLKTKLIFCQKDQVILSFKQSDSLFNSLLQKAFKGQLVK